MENKFESLAVLNTDTEGPAKDALVEAIEDVSVGDVEAVEVMETTESKEGDNNTLELSTESPTLTQRLETIQAHLPTKLVGSLPITGEKAKALIDFNNENVLDSKNNPNPIEVPKVDNLENLKVSITVSIDGAEVHFVDLSPKDLGLIDSPRISDFMNATFLNKWSEINLPEGHRISLCKATDGMEITRESKCPDRDAPLAMKLEGKLTLVGGGSSESFSRLVSVSSDLRIGQTEKVIFRYN